MQDLCLVRSYCPTYLLHRGVLRQVTIQVSSTTASGYVGMHAASRFWIFGSPYSLWMYKKEILLYSLFSLSRLFSAPRPPPPLSHM